jgi:hypothetical protein
LTRGAARASLASMTTIETDYLVVGAGAAGMAFTDSLIAGAEADVVLVDRRHRPGGHWNDAYPFVRLHQPSAFYGVNSRVLGSDSIDQVGPNAGLYERATAAEICAYFQAVLDEHLVPSNQVRFFGSSEYQGVDGETHRFVSRLTGEATEVRVRRRFVDATYLETPVPSTHTPSFNVDPDARVVPVNGLVDVAEPPAGFTIIGAGKTAMDACTWLLDAGVAPDRIRWIRPRDAWLLNRLYQQPLELVGSLMEGVSLYLEAAAEAVSVEDLYRRLEACEQLIRLDDAVQPTMYRCATVSPGELEQLRQIENVVRLGRIQRVASDRIELADGSIPAAGHLNVDCSAAGLRLSPARPIFEEDRITLQQVRTCQPTFNAALLAFVETTDRNDAEKNRLCPPNPYPNGTLDWMPGTVIAGRAQGAWGAEPDLVAWMEASRLDAARGIGDHLSEPRMQSALARYGANFETGHANLEKLMAG